MPLVILALLGSPATARDLGSPLPPPVVEASATADGALVAWQPPFAVSAEPLLAYHVYRLAPTGGWVEVGATDASTLSFLDPDPPAAMSVYAVAAENDHGESLRSAPTAVGTACNPAGLAATPSLAVGWDCIGPPSGQVLAGLDDVALPETPGGAMCDPVVVAGTPPQVGVNWACVGLQPQVLLVR